MSSVLFAHSFLNAYAVRTYIVYTVPEGDNKVLSVTVSEQLVRDETFLFYPKRGAPCNRNSKHHDNKEQETE